MRLNILILLVVLVGVKLLSGSTAGSTARLIVFVCGITAAGILAFFHILGEEAERSVRRGRWIFLVTWLCAVALHQFAIVVPSCSAIVLRENSQERHVVINRANGSRVLWHPIPWRRTEREGVQYLGELKVQSGNHPAIRVRFTGEIGVRSELRDRRAVSEMTKSLLKKYGKETEKIQAELFKQGYSLIKG